MKRISLLLAATIALFSVNKAGAEVVAYWNFNDATVSSANLAAPDGGTQSGTASISFNSVGTFLPSPGAGNYGVFGGSTLNALNSDPAGNALSVVGSSLNGGNITFSLSMASLSGLQVSYATRGTATGFTTQTWGYSTDNITFTDLTPITGRNVTSFSTQTVDFSAVTALNNDSSVFIRLIFSGATNTTGNNRIDNVQFTAIPEPHEYALGLAGLLGLLVILRRRREAKAN